MKLFSTHTTGPDAGSSSAAAAEAVPEERIHDLDVRPILARGEEPLATILEHAGRVPAGHVLRLRAPFEPVPLYAVLAERGFSARTERLAPADWRVWFRRAAEGEDELPGRDAAGGRAD